MRRVRALARDLLGKRLGLFERGETEGGGVIWCGVFLNHEWTRMGTNEGGSALARDLLGKRVSVFECEETAGWWGGLLCEGGFGAVCFEPRMNTNGHE